MCVSLTHPEPQRSRGGVCSGVCGGVCLRVSAAVFAVFAGVSARRNTSGTLHLGHALHHRLRLHLHRRRRHGLGAGQQITTSLDSFKPYFSPSPYDEDAILFFVKPETCFLKVH